MSNRIDFFPSEQNRLALPAAGVSVLVDGQLCAELELIEIVRGGWGEFSWARLAYNPVAYETDSWKDAEEVQAEFAMGKRVCIRRVFNDIAPGAAACCLPVFEGHIDAMETRLSAGGETVEVIARDFSAILSRITVYGQRVAKADGSSVFLSGLDTVFNPDGRANAAVVPVEASGRCYTGFCAEPSRARAFSYAEVLDYLLCEYLVVGQLQTPDINRLRSLTEQQIVRDLDVTGLSLLEALQRCCERISLRFRFEPRLSETGPRQAMVFYKSAAGRAVELNYQPAGEQLSISRTNVASLHSKRDFWPITHKFIGQGDFKVYEATFELVKAWDPADEDTDYERFSPTTNPDFYQVKGVYRKWCLNEAGDYTGEPYNQGEAFDFSKIFEGGSYCSHRRRFWPALTTDKQGKSLGYFLEVSFNDGQNWWQYLYAFNNLLDECGVWLSSDQLDLNTFVAALKGTLRFRITASVVSDERLSCSLADGPVGSTVPVVEHVITLPRQFKYRKVSAQSIFAGANNDGLGVPDEVDDTTALYEFIRHRAEASPYNIETIDAQTPYLILDYQPGDRVTTSPDSTDLFSTRSDNRSASWLERVQMDFVKQCTNVKVVRKRGNW